MRLIDADALSKRMYHDAFEVDSDMQRWDSGCWIRYKMFEKAIEDAPTIEPERKRGKWVIMDNPKYVVQHIEDDLISRQEVKDAIAKAIPVNPMKNDYTQGISVGLGMAETMIEGVPSAQPTLFGYNIEHLKLIAYLLQKENLPPERVAEALNDISRVVEIVSAEFEETLRKEVEQCKI